MHYLDWRLFARTDRYYVKRFEDETNLRCHLLLDLSRSMAFGALEYTKIEYARTLAATLAYYLSLQRDAVGLLTFHQEIEEYIPAQFRPGHLHRVLVALERVVAGAGTDVGRPMRHLADLVHKRGLVILISDLLAPVEQLRENLSYLSSCGHEIVVMRVLDPAERTFTFSAPALFVDLESGREMYVDPREIRALSGAVRTTRARCRTGVPRARHRLPRVPDRPAAGTGAVRLHPVTDATGSRPVAPAIRYLRRTNGERTMSLLTPLYVLGLAAISLPILFHLIRRTPTGRVAFSSLMFVTATPPRLTRRSRLDQWLLLLLRAAALILLALAFARPFWRTASVSDVGDLPDRTMVLLVDTSASMRRAGIWSQVVAQVNDVVRDLSPGDLVALYGFDSRVTRWLSLDESGSVPASERARLVRSRLEQARPGWQDGAG